MTVGEQPSGPGQDQPYSWLAKHSIGAGQPSDIAPVTPSARPDFISSYEAKAREAEALFGTLDWASCSLPLDGPEVIAAAKPDAARLDEAWAMVRASEGVIREQMGQIRYGSKDGKSAVLTARLVTERDDELYEKLQVLNVPNVTSDVEKMTHEQLSRSSESQGHGSEGISADTLGQEVAGYTVITVGTQKPGYRGYDPATYHLVVFTMPLEVQG